MKDGQLGCISHRRPLFKNVRYQAGIALWALALLFVMGGPAMGAEKPSSTANVEETAVDARSLVMEVLEESELWSGVGGLQTPDECRAEAARVVAERRRLTSDEVNQIVQRFVSNTSAAPESDVLDKALAAFVTKDFRSAAKHATQAVKSTDGPLTRKAWVLKGNAHFRAGDYVPALEAYRSAIALVSRDTAQREWTQVATLLYRTLYELGILKEAEGLVRQVLDLNEKTLGKNHPMVAADLNHLARILQLTSRFTEAEPLYLRALKIDEAKYGIDHPAVSSDLNNYALLLSATGRQEEAVEMLRRSLDIKEANDERVTGNYSITLNNLADILVELDQVDEAKKLVTQSLQIKTKVFGEAHPITAFAIDTLAQILHDEGRYKEAEALMRRSLGIYESRYGTDHEKVASTCRSLGFLMTVVKRSDEAEAMFRRALEIHEKTLGKQDRSVARDLSHIATVMKLDGRREKAILLMRQALAIDEKALGKDHPLVADDLTTLAYQLRSTGKNEEAEPLLRRAWVIYEKHEKQEKGLATALGELGQLLHDQKRYREAEPVMKKVVTLEKKLHGKSHSKIATALNNLGMLLRDAGHDHGAEPILREALKISAQNSRPTESERQNHQYSIENYASVLLDLGLSKSAIISRMRKVEAGEAVPDLPAP